LTVRNYQQKQYITVLPRFGPDTLKTKDFRSFGPFEKKTLASYLSHALLDEYIILGRNLPRPFDLEIAMGLIWRGAQQRQLHAQYI